MGMIGPNRQDSEKFNNKTKFLSKIQEVNYLIRQQVEQNFLKGKDNRTK